jgi:hypothetical protein
MRAIKIILTALAAMIALPLILIGVAIGVIVASAKAVVKAGPKPAISPKPVSGTSDAAKASEPVVDKPIVDFNKFPFGREDKGGSC